MTSRISKIASSLKQLGDVQVNDWDFMELLNTDLGELEVTRSLRRLGGIRVTDWDFKNPLPAVGKLARTEVDLVGIFKRTANYKVLDWDFRRPAPEAPSNEGPGHTEMLALIARLKDFLQFVTVNLIAEPIHARISVEEIQTHVLRFKLVLVNRDVAMLIGHGGHTAAAIRNLLKMAAGRHHVHALLDIVSHEEDAARKGV